RPMSTHRAWRPTPGLPGAANSVSTTGLCAIFHASACSRPPPPTMNSLMASLWRVRRLDDFEVGAGDARPRAARVELEIALPVLDGLAVAAVAGEGAGEIEVGVGVVGRGLGRFAIVGGRVVDHGGVLVLRRVGSG